MSEAPLAMLVVTAYRTIMNLIFIASLFKGISKIYQPPSIQRI